MVRFACSTADFPLTLTLSLREREQQASDWCLADDRWANSGTGVIERRWTILPLPAGEGRGEGDASVAKSLVQSVEEEFVWVRLRRAGECVESPHDFDAVHWDHE